MPSTWTLVKTLYDQSWPPKSKFAVEDIPDLSGRVIIVTGGNAGVGKETVKALLKKNAKVYLGARSKQKAELAMTEIREATGKEPIFLELDLANLASVKRSAEEFMNKERELHILFNNAGVMTPPIGQVTSDGYDLQFGTNVLGHFYFTKLLIPALLEGKKTSPDLHARIVTTSSFAAYVATIDWKTLKDGPERRKLSTQTLYSQSKFGNVVVANEFARRYGHEGIVSMSVNPGNLKTELQRHSGKYRQKIISAILLNPAPMGALTQLWGGTMPETLNYNGEFLIPWARLGRCREEAYDEEPGKKLWDWLEEQTETIS